MRSLLLLIAFSIAAVVKAVVVEWTIPNAQVGTWVKDASVYFVYASSQISGSDYSAIAPSASLLPDVKPESNTSSYYIKAGVNTIAKDVTIEGAYGQFDSLSSRSDFSSGYFYMVVFSKSDSNLYAVAGGTQYVPGGSAGIRLNQADGPNALPEVGNFIDLDRFLGGTWSAAINAPEPTVVALLAFGFAGLLLRRKTL